MSVANVRLAALMLELVLDAVYLLGEAFWAVLAPEPLDVQMGGVIVPFKAVASLVVLLASLK